MCFSLTSVFRHVHSASLVTQVALLTGNVSIWRPGRKFLWLPGAAPRARAHLPGPLLAPSPSRPPPGASSVAHAASPSANTRARSGPGPLCSGFVPAAAAQRWGWLSNFRASSRLLRCIYLMPGLQNKCMSPRHSFSPATYFHGGQKKKKSIVQCG